MKIKTEILKEMVSKAIKGASNNKMIPISSLIGIEYLDDTLTLMTTDGSNQLRVIETEVPLGITEKQDNFYTIVNADLFAKLVGKTTKEFIELDNNENHLDFKGNGNYKLDIAINEEGEMVKFPNIKSKDLKNPISISIEKLKTNLNILKPSVAKTMELPYLTGIYLSNRCVATDRQMMCYIQNDLLEEPILIPSKVVELLDLLEGDAVDLYKEENTLYFVTNKIIIVGKELEGKNEYPVNQIGDVVNQKYENQVQVNKQELLEVLDRMTLFVSDAYDKNGVYLKFNENILEIRSQKNNAIEYINIQSKSKSTLEYECLIDIEMLSTEVKNVLNDVVNISYGQDISIKIIDNDVTFIISLVEKTN